MNNPRYRMTGYDDACPYHPNHDTNWEYSEFFNQFVPGRCSECEKEIEQKRRNMTPAEKKKARESVEMWNRALKESHNMGDLVPEGVKTINKLAKKK